MSGSASVVARGIGSNRMPEPATGSWTVPVASSCPWLGELSQASGDLDGGSVDGALVQDDLARLRPTPDRCSVAIRRSGNRVPTEGGRPCLADASLPGDPGDMSRTRATRRPSITSTRKDHPLAMGTSSPI